MRRNPGTRKQVFSQVAALAGREPLFRPTPRLALVTMSTSKRSSGGHPGFLLAALLALSAIVAVGAVVGLELLVGEWWVAAVAIGTAVLAWALVAVATYERPARGPRPGAGTARALGGRAPGSAHRRSRIA